jgi:alkylation response protein AidB-like acyl-CoA dehydrogenase
MDFGDTPEQAALREAVRAFARRHGAPEQLRATMASSSGYDPATWARLTGEPCLTALAVPEGLGGAGAGPGEAAVAVEELGRVLLPSPYLSFAVVTLALAGAAGQCPEAADSPGNTRHTCTSSGPSPRSCCSARPAHCARISAGRPACWPSAGQPRR